MSPRKLSDADKQEIISLYKQTDETTSTLATRFGVSSSTISRFLKTNLSEKEYEDLIQQKRLARTPREQSIAPEIVKQQLELAIDKPTETNLIEELSTPTDREDADSAIRRRKRRSSASSQLEDETAVSEVESLKVKLPSATRSVPEKTSELTPPETASAPVEKERIIEKKVKTIAPVVRQTEISVAEAEELKRVEAFTLEEMLGEDVSDLDDIDDDDDDDDDDEDDNDWNVAIESSLSRKGKNANLKVLPLSKASLPKTCYLVVDRLAELIVLPMKDFAALGTISEEEIRQKTLPVFDNHRVARRFSHRSQRVIKVPDSQMLQKTSSYLQAKGITRLLLDGQIYSLFT
ncbi:MAG: hypothetical protein ACRC2R_14475 [Xenococcaceae cyanobacterium]